MNEMSPTKKPLQQRRSVKEQRVRRRISQADLRLARQIQQNLFPPSPCLPGFDAAGASFPADATGGDYYDFIPLPDGRLGVAVGDVSGHGFGAALLMAATRAYLRGLARAHAAPSEVLAAANRSLTEDTGSDHFVTLSLVALEPRVGRLAYASAGHPYGYVLGTDGKVKARLPSTGIPLGIMAEAAFPPGPELTLEPGELALFLTDGVTEAQSPDGTTFGVRRALDIVRVCRREAASHIVCNLYHAVRAFCRNRPQVDDITAVVLKANPFH
jgi:sigma-B regulation protein RsbU (phosphoserine phosphatase)